MTILESLIPRNKNNFNIPLLTMNDTKKLIKNSWTICNTNLSMNVIKKINSEMAPHLTHLYNCMTRTGIYPDIMKTSKIIPLHKPGNRPINILGPVDKIYQEHIKINLTSFLETNNIISKFHHGGRKKHGTQTALAMIMNNLYQ